MTSTATASVPAETLALSQGAIGSYRDAHQATSADAQRSLRDFTTWAQLHSDPVEAPDGTWTLSNLGYTVRLDAAGTTIISYRSKTAALPPGASSTRIGGTAGERGPAQPLNSILRTDAGTFWVTKKTAAAARRLGHTGTVTSIRASVAAAQAQRNGTTNPDGTHTLTGDGYEWLISADGTVILGTRPAPPTAVVSSKAKAAQRLRARNRRR